MLKSFKLEKQQPVLYGPGVAISFQRKKFIKLSKVYVLFNGMAAKFAESALYRTNSELVKVNNNLNTQPYTCADVTFFL